MVFLAGHTQRQVPVSEIAQELKVSEAHLSKVMQRLAKSGLVNSTRGPKGGFILERAGDDITLLEVYEAIEGPLVETPCLLGEKICLGDTCILGGLPEKVDRQVREYLTETTLADLSSMF